MGVHPPGRGDLPCSPTTIAKTPAKEYQLVGLEHEDDLEQQGEGSIPTLGEENRDPDLLSDDEDDDEGNKLHTIKIFSFARPHMRAFHLAWIGFCTVRTLSIVRGLPAARPHE